MQEEAAAFLTKQARRIGQITLEQKNALERMLSRVRSLGEPVPIRMGYFPIDEPVWYASEPPKMQLHAAVPVPTPEARWPLHSALWEKAGLVPTTGMMVASLLEDEQATEALTRHALRDYVLLASRTDYLRPGWNGGRVLKRTPLVIGANHPELRRWEERNAITYLDRPFLPRMRYNDGSRSLEDAAMAYT